ncbi:hypothetical protein GCM10011348_35180 [Marinobacterium nitratireducens]|uniref:peptidylprolyl isomerase n=1 Tax=Marinobacterium nitratireducens TaxID=518897 RepID=A0A918DX12_9GAMM|nr:peptidylprolyl isomerase [Marinobacterium nitratireducens]GGO85798.1 hypothetical protein GCM10011348_35180 [Marinobacterium nitratireducens]
MSESGTESRRWWREPLLHFFIIGVLLFPLFDWLGDIRAQDRILVTRERIDNLSSVFARTWQRQPTRQELDGLIDDYVREEIAAREARARGLDQDDVVIRRRLRQKLEFLVTDSVTSVPPTEQQLQDWLSAHPDPFRSDPEYAFRQVFLDPNKHAGTLERDAERLLQRLRAAGGKVDIRNIGDSLMVPRDIERMSVGEIGRVFGERFAQQVIRLQPETWSGPLLSGYGVHLVYLLDRRTGAVPPLSEIRPQVEARFLEQRRQQALDNLYQSLRQRYPVTIESREEQGGDA